MVEGICRQNWCPLQLQYDICKHKWSGDETSQFSVWHCDTKVVKVKAVWQSFVLDTGIVNCNLGIRTTSPILCWASCWAANGKKVSNGNISFEVLDMDRPNTYVMLTFKQSFIGKKCFRSWTFLIYGKVDLWNDMLFQTKFYSSHG